jgi:hypothetical protein
MGWIPAMMDHDKAVQKIRKCLALSKSSNPNEAASALRQAQALMRQYGVTDDDVALSDVHEVGTRVASEVLPAWDTSLASTVASAFGCHRFVSSVQIGTRACRSQWIFVGINPGADLARYAYEVLQRQCMAARKAHVAAQPKNCKQATKTARGDAFALAWVMAVSKMVQAFAGDDSRTELLESYMQAKHPGLASFKAKRRDLGRNVRDDSFWQGAQAGRQARLDRGVSGSPQPLAVGLD